MGQPDSERVIVNGVTVGFVNYFPWVAEPDRPWEAFVPAGPCNRFATHDDAVAWLKERAGMSATGERGRPGTDGGDGMAKWTLTLDEGTCGIIAERLEQTVEDLTRWVTGGRDVLAPATFTMLCGSLEEVTEAYNDFMGAYCEATERALAGAGGQEADADG